MTKNSRLICIIPLFGLATFLLFPRSEYDEQTIIPSQQHHNVPSQTLEKIVPLTNPSTNLVPHGKSIDGAIPGTGGSVETDTRQYSEILPGKRLCDPRKPYSDNDVVLAGNQPVGTYLCSYFPEAAPRVNAGCVLSCISYLYDKTPFKCEIIPKASFDQLYTVDIVVNHHGPVPKKKNGKPYLTIFYSGESNASERVKATAQYQSQYDKVVSFHQFRRHYFTWTNRHLKEFNEIAQSSTNGQLWNSTEWTERKSAIVVFVSRCKGGRKRVIRELAKYYTVYSFGACARTHQVHSVHPECASKPGGRYASKTCVLKKYKFVLALENTRELDYVTEKVYHALLSGAVPIYDGAPNVGGFLPGGLQSLIQVADFSKDPGSRTLGDSNSNNVDINFKDLSDHLRRVENDRDLQASLFRWRSHPKEWSDAFKNNLYHLEPTCDICAEARELKRCSNA